MASSSNNGGLALNIMELQPVHHAPQQQDLHVPSTNVQGGGSLASILGRIPRKARRSNDKKEQDINLQQAEDRHETLPSPSVAFEELPRWNSPRINAYRTAATFWSFIIMGMNDAAYGVSTRTKMDICLEVLKKY